jgi:hypothetical protein
MPTRFLWLLGFVIVVSFLMSLLERKRRQTNWAGVVSDIKHQRPAITRDEDRRDEDWVTVYYRTDEGGRGKFKLRMASVRQHFKTIQVGERLIKHQGDYLPCKPRPELAESPAEQVLSEA